MTDSNNHIYDVVIIGGGPAGLAAAVYCARSKLDTLVIDKNPHAGALNSAGWIENYPGIPERVRGSELLSRIHSQAERFGTVFTRSEVIGVDFSQKVRKIFTAQGNLSARSLIIATGAMGRKPTIPGEAEFTGRGVAYCAACDAPLFEGQDVAVTGKPELIQEDLPEIARFARHVYLLPIPSRTASDQSGIAASPNVELLSGYTIAEISGDTLVRGIRVKDNQGKEKTLDVSGVFMYLQGRVPIADFLGGSVNQGEDKCIIVNREDMATSITGVYAAGDVTCKKVRQSVTASAEGCLAAISVITYLNAQKISG